MQMPANKGYTIYTEIKPGKYDPELQKQLSDLSRQSKDRKNKTIIGKLEKLIKKYPDVPVLKNYLATAYTVKSLPKKARELNLQILAEHPDYLHAKINEAVRLMAQGEIEKVPEILGSQMELQALYPEKNEFHLSEVMGFLDAAIQYYVGIGDLEQAESQLEFLEQLVPYDYRTRDLKNLVFRLKMTKALEKIKDLQSDPISPEIEEKPLPEQTTQPPKLHHPEIGELYYHGFNIAETKLMQILALPRQTLIADLQTLLADGVQRFDYFEEGNEIEANDIVLHALFLLGELKATEALPAITDFVEYNEKILDFWLGDHLTETLWRVFYGIGQEQPEVLEDFMLNPRANEYAKGAAAKALQQIILHHPEKREAVLQIFTRLFNTFIKAEISDNIIDSEFIGFAVIGVMQSGLKELLPQIRQLYDKGYFSESMTGTYTKIEDDIAKIDPGKYKKEILPLPQFYQHTYKSWGYGKEETQIQAKPAPAIKKYAFTEPAGKEPKILPGMKAGRNDPCPCGSGKKFKKCCGS